MINFVIPISYGKQFVLDLVKIINSGEYSFNKDYKIISDEDKLLLGSIVNETKAIAKSIEKGIYENE